MARGDAIAISMFEHAPWQRQRMLRSDGSTGPSGAGFVLTGTLGQGPVAAGHHWVPHCQLPGTPARQNRRAGVQARTFMLSSDYGEFGLGCKDVKWFSNDFGLVMRIPAM